MDILSTNAAVPWYGWPQEAPVFGNDPSTLIFDQDFTSVSHPLPAVEYPLIILSCIGSTNWCNCSGMSGPCDFHQEQMRAKCSSTIGTPSPHPSLSQTTESQIDPSNSGMRSKPALRVPMISSTQTSCSLLQSGPSRIISKSNSRSPAESEPSQGIKKQRSHTPKNTPNTSTISSRNSSGADLFEGTKDTNTARFQTILDTVQAVGFENFDAAVSSYYTHTFERNSTADLAQKTSRARRLAGVMTSLHESSATWTLWEARGYRHQIAEAAESIYSSEVIRLANSRKRKRGHSLAPGRDSRSCSEFESSSSEIESSTPSTASTRSRPGSEETRTSLGQLQRVYQNKVRNHPVLSAQEFNHDH